MAFGLLAFILIVVSISILPWIIASILPTSNKRKIPPWIIASILPTSNKTKIPPPKAKGVPTSNTRKILPKAKGAWPIIGHLHNILDHTTLAAMADEYGPIFTIQLGLTQGVVVSSSEVAKKIFVNHDLAVSSRPSYIANYYFGYNIMFGLVPYGPYWREMRKVSTIHLLSNAKLEQMKHVRVSEIKDSIRELYELWRRKEGRYKMGWVTVEMKQWILDMTFNIIVRIVAGKRYHGYADVKSEEARRCQAALREFFDMLGVIMLGDFVPFLRWLDWGGYEKSMKKSSKELDSIIQGWLDEHRLMRKELSNQEKKEQDFMGLLLTILEGTENFGHDSDTINKATCVNLLVGGSDTTTVTVTWALSLLLNNPQTLKMAQDELDKVVGRDRQVEESDIPNLPYLQSIVKETLRLYPAAPLSAPRHFDKDCVIDDYHILKGSWLIVNLHKIHRDPEVWSDPLEFRPERFLTTHKMVDMNSQNFELMPFGSGRRMCPGSSFGLSIIHLTLASFLHAFKSCNPSEAPIDMEEGFGMIVPRANPLNLLISPRLSAHLYD